ncbi:hypothetical protein [Algoriphagus sp. NG3]|uniref:hypothetical protein n=1 Tax=unclassified Algoriphagus TaxID=2641541 RepID=UPI002A80372B|nr:hypothetical protein [Algoriphagus sp. NG3]WPR76925.1 hypothetical protein SLW71_06180 [Algoriphagus sp. NG3]
MKSKLLLLIAYGLLLFSCNNDEEINPEVLTRNQWQNVVENTSADRPYEYVFSIEFKPNGKVYSEAFFRDLETKELIGFREYLTGSFQIISGNIMVSILELYTIQGSDDMYLDKEELSILDGENLSRVFELRNKNTELHTIMPPLSSSLGMIYYRVD